MSLLGKFAKITARENIDLYSTQVRVGCMDYAQMLLPVFFFFWSGGGFKKEQNCVFFFKINVSIYLYKFTLFFSSSKDG